MRKQNVLWVDDKGRERGLMIGMWEKQRPDINFLPFDSTAALKAWMKVRIQIDLAVQSDLSISLTPRASAP